MKNIIQKIKDFFIRLDMRIEFQVHSRDLTVANKEIGEGGLVDWSMMNFLYELKFGTIESARAQLKKFERFVKDRKIIALQK